MWYVACIGIANEIKTSLLQNETIQTVGRSGFVHGEGNIALADYDENHGFIQDNIDICTVQQRFFADSPFGPRTSRRFSISLQQGDENSHWFSQVLLLFCVKLEGVAESMVELASVSYFEVTSPMERTYRAQRFLSLRWKKVD